MTAPSHVAAYLVRDAIDTLIQRHERGTDAVSVAVVTLATRLLQHVTDEAKGMRAEKP
jgi:hypothetical protein